MHALVALMLFQIGWTSTLAVQKFFNGNKYITPKYKYKYKYLGSEYKYKYQVPHLW